MTLTREQKLEKLALLEERRRRQAVQHLDDYCRFITIPGAPIVADSCPQGDDCTNPNCTQHEVSTAFYPDTVEPAAHHQLLNRILEKVERNEIDPKTGHTFNRVMIFMPPGSAKSTYASVTFPTWYMGKNPHKNIISTSYGSTLSKKFGRKCQSITSSAAFYNLFGTCLMAGNRAVDDWALTNGSTYMCGGILSGITGNRADGLVIDDPVKGREDADSPAIREKTWDAYLNDLRTRLKPGGWITLVQTRWHEDDLSGRILPDNWNGQSGWVISQDGEPWYIVCLPAQCERADDPLGRTPGEWLWTDWFSEAHWEREKRVQGARNWDALYQQRPKPAEGAIFKREWLQRYHTPPEAFIQIVFSLDSAYKPEQVNDPSVLTVWGQTEHHHYLLDLWRGRVEYPELKRVLANLYMRWLPNVVLIEDKSSGQSLIQECRAGVALKTYDKPIHMPIVAIEPKGSKLERAVRTSSIIEARMVSLPEVAPWLIDFESELFGFPLVTHDDQVDSVTQYLDYAAGKSTHLSMARTGSQADKQALHDLKTLGYSTNRGRNQYRGF